MGKGMNRGWSPSDNQFKTEPLCENIMPRLLQGVLQRTIQKFVLMKFARGLPVTWDMWQISDVIGTFEY